MAKEKLLHKKSNVIFSIWVLSLLYSFYLHYKLGMDAFWDTAHYHYYVGWASSMLSPYSFGAAAQYQTYLNPLIDVVNYLTFSVHPFLGALFHSLAFSFTLIILYSVSYRVLNKTTDTYNMVLSIWSIIIAATAAMTVSLFGSFTNEHITSLFGILAIWFSLEYFQKDKLILIFYSGLFVGFAVGLKLTAAPFLLGLFFTIILISKFSKKTILYMFVGATLGVILADGIFMLLRWLETGNPIFPVANNIFKSPLYPTEWLTFSKFEPNKILYYLYLPIKWIYAGDFSEANSIRDGRLFLAYLGLIMILISVVIKKKKLTKEEMLIVYFFIFSWLLWILAFRIYRYLVLLELLSGVLFLIGLKMIFSEIHLRVTAIVISTILLCVITVYPDWGRRPWDDKFIKSDIAKVLPTNTDDVFVFFAEDRTAYLAPDLNNMNIEFASLFSQEWYDRNPKWNPIDKKTVDISNKKIYFLQYSRFEPKEHSKYLKDIFSKKRYECTKLKTNMYWNPYLCHYTDSAIREVEFNIIYENDRNELLFSEGWLPSGPESRWSTGVKSVVYIKLPKQSKHCNPSVIISGHTLFPKEFLQLDINGVTVFDANLTGVFNITASIKNIDSLNNGLTKLEFNLPDASNPPNGDPRLPAIALANFEFICEKRNIFDK